MKAFKWVAAALGGMVLVLTLVVLIFLQLKPVSTPPQLLSDHPNAHWSGDVDGGAFFEIVKAELPRYLLQIRHQSGSLWMEGWVTEPVRQLSGADFWAYGGGSDVYLKNGKQLLLENRDGSPVQRGISP